MTRIQYTKKLHRSDDMASLWHSIRTLLTKEVDISVFKCLFVYRKIICRQNSETIWNWISSKSFEFAFNWGHTTPITSFGESNFQFWSFCPFLGLFWPKSSSKKCQLFSYIILGETNGEFLSKTNEKSTYKVSWVFWLVLNS